MTSSLFSQSGRVFFVGAGPGNPGLITVRGLECLRLADVVLYDYLANARVLMPTRSDCEKICLGRHRRSDVWPQNKINEEMVRRARAGQCVVRLKGGDPMVFGRAAEELAAVAEAQIPFEIVPGVTTASAVGAYTGVPITDRGFASAVALVTGHERMGKPDSSLDFQSLATFPGTLVFYMGVSTVRTWSSALIAAGKPTDTPVLVVRRCTWPDQLTLPTTLGQVAELLSPYSRIPPPAAIVVGEAARQQNAFNWFSRLPLLGQRVIVTRPEDQAADLMRDLEAMGAHVVCQPAIRIRPPTQWGDLDAAIDRLGQFDVVIFSSANGVRFFMDRLFQRGLDVRQLAGTRLAVVGPAAARGLADYHLKVDIQPDVYRAEALVQLLTSEAEGRRFLSLRASRGRDVLAKSLRQAGGHVEEVVAYINEDETELNEETKEFLAGGEGEWVTATSSAIARSLVALFGKRLGQSSVASISPITSQTLRSCGIEPAVEANEHTPQGVIEAILAAVAGP